MKPSSSSKLGFFSSYSTSTTVTYTYHNDHPAPSPQHPNSSTQLPSPNPITLHQSQSNAALTIQSFYRAHRIRTLYRKISAVDSEADHLQRLIQRQDTVDAVRSNHLEKLRMNEALMALLLKLDSVPGFDPTVREARRKVTRRIVGLQEILDSVSEAKVDDECNYWWDYYSGSMKNWDQVIADMEESVCRERGGDEMERFCAQNLGFRCLQSQRVLGSHCCSRISWCNWTLNCHPTSTEPCSVGLACRMDSRSSSGLQCSLCNPCHLQVGNPV